MKNSEGISFAIFCFYGVGVLEFLRRDFLYSPPPRWGEVVEFDMNGGLSMIAVGAEKRVWKCLF